MDFKMADTSERRVFCNTILLKYHADDANIQNIVDTLDSFVASFKSPYGQFPQLDSQTDRVNDGNLLYAVFDRLLREIDCI